MAAMLARVVVVPDAGALLAAFGRSLSRGNNSPVTFAPSNERLRATDLTRDPITECPVLGHGDGLTTEARRAKDFPRPGFRNDALLRRGFAGHPSLQRVLRACGDLGSPKGWPCHPKLAERRMFQGPGFGMTPCYAKASQGILRREGFACMRGSRLSEGMAVPSEARGAKDGGGDAISTRTEVALISALRVGPPAVPGFRPREGRRAGLRPTWRKPRTRSRDRRARVRRRTAPGECTAHRLTTASQSLESGAVSVAFAPPSTRPAGRRAPPSRGLNHAT